MSSNEEYALRIANGEKLSAILDEVYAQGWNDYRSRGESVRGDDQDA